MIAAGAAILFLGTTDVFVVEDLAYMGLTREMLQGMNPRLVPLIAHDRAGFGGGLATTGLLVLFCALHARPPEPIIPPGHTAGSRLVRFQARARVTVAIEYASARGNR